MQNKQINKFQFDGNHRGGGSQAVLLMSEVVIKIEVVRLLPFFWWVILGGMDTFWHNFV